MNSPVDFEEENEHLVTKVREGDAVAFETIFRRYYPMLCDVAAVIVGSYESAEEITADVFARIWENRGAWNPPAVGVRPYLIRAVRNRSFNYVRDSSLRRLKGANKATESDIPGMGDAPLSPDAQVESESVVKLVWDAVASLPPTTQLMLTLRWKHGLSWDEVAASIGSNTIAVQMQYLRARKVLRARLSGLIE